MTVTYTYYSMYGAFPSTVNQLILEPGLDANYACNAEAHQLGGVAISLVQTAPSDGYSESFVCNVTEDYPAYAEAALNAYCQSKYGTQATGVAVAAFATAMGAGWASGPIGYAAYIGAEEVCEAAGHGE